MLDALQSILQPSLDLLALPGALPIAAVLLGLIIGSFLNTVVHRLPRMLEREWQAQCAELAGGTPPSATRVESTRYNLLTPRSHCPECRTPIRAVHLVPLLGWLLLRGQCAACGTRIPLRYPLIEATTAVLFGVCALRFGVSMEFVVAVFISSVLLALAVIDFDTHYLPDQLTLPLLWAGLAAALAGDLHAAVAGAIIGYLILWLVYHAFKLATGKEGMGYGDFKLLAALGAWLGPEALLPIVLASSIAGAAVGIVLILFAGRAREAPLAFGPYLAIAGWLVMIAGETLPGGLLLGKP